MSEGQTRPKITFAPKKRWNPGLKTSNDVKYFPRELGQNYPWGGKGPPKKNFYVFSEASYNEVFSFHKKCVILRLKEDNEYIFAFNFFKIIYGNSIFPKN